MVHIVSKTLQGQQAVIVAQADGQEEVKGLAARNLVLQEAASLGLSRPGLSGNDTTYPVDADGNSDDEVMQGKRPVAGYRCDYHVSSGL
jgi:hypothetical protein